MPKLAINKKAMMFITVVMGVLILFVLIYKANITKDSELKQEDSQTRILKFSYEVANNSNQAIHAAQFSSYLPVERMSNQRSGAINTQHSFKEKMGDLGNRIAHFDLGEIPPFGKKLIKFTAQIETVTGAAPISLSKKKEYLAADKFVEIQHPKIQSLSESLTGATAEETAHNIYQWVIDHINYVGYISQDKGALHAIESKTGDCTEYMYAVVALARAAGIPARGIGGYVYDTHRIVKPVDYHNWAEVYFNGRWNIIDAQKQNFMQNTQDYIAMRILSDEAASLLGSSHRFSVANKNLTIRMN